MDLHRNCNPKKLLAAAGLLMAAEFTLSLFLGKYPLALPGVLAGKPQSVKVFFTLRLPRTLMALAGGFGLGITLAKIRLPLAISLARLAVLFLLYRQILLLSVEEEEALLLGVPVRNMRLVILFTATLVVTSIVSVTGLFSFIGLLAPHAARLLTRENRMSTLWLGGLLGGILLCGADILARTLVENSRLLLLGEPDSALDIPNRYGIMHIIAQIVKGQPRAGILSLHDPMLALEFCDQLVLIKNGRRIGSIFPALDSLEAMEHALEQIYGPVTLAECAGKDGKKKPVLFTAARLSAP